MSSITRHARSWSWPRATAPPRSVRVAPPARSRRGPAVAQEVRERQPQVELEEAPPPASGVTGAALDGLSWSKRLLIGRPRATREIGETLLPKSLALPIFSS